MKILAVGRILWRRYILEEKSKSQIDNNTCFILVDCICCQKRNLNESTEGRLLRKELNETEGETDLFCSPQPRKV